MANNPCDLEYDTLEQGHAPRFGVTSSISEDFTKASRTTYAWFVNIADAIHFVKISVGCVWDLVEGVKVSL